MPIKSDRGDYFSASAPEVARQRQSQHDQESDQADADVQAMKAGKGKKGGGEQISVDRHALIEQVEIFATLTHDKDRAQQDRNQQPEVERTRVVPPQALFREPES